MRGLVTIASLALSSLVPVAGRALEASFVRGDVDGLGSVNLTDAIIVLEFLFTGGSAPVGCKRAADVNDDGKVDIADGVRLLRYLFLQGDPPEAPFPACGPDRTEDALDCVSARTCAGRSLILVLDKSSSMAGKPFLRAQQEALAAVQEFDDSSWFAVVFFDASITRFPNSGVPAPGTEAMKMAATAYISASTPGHSSCMKAGLLSALYYAAQIPAGADPRIVIFSDGMTECGGNDPTAYGASTLAEVTFKNTGGIPIDSVCTGAAGAVDEAWMLALSAQNGGSYTRIVVP